MNSNSSTTDPKIDLYLVCENLCFQEDYHAYVKITQVPIAAMYILFISILIINIVTCFFKKNYYYSQNNLIPNSTTYDQIQHA